MALLADTPRRLAACAKGRSDAALAKKPNPKGWSAVEHLAHVRGCAEVWGFSIYIMVDQPEPVLPELNPRRWAKTRRLAKLGFHASLDAFAAARAELLPWLRALPAPAWNRKGIIKRQWHSVYSQVQRMALHEEKHCEQVEALFG